ncbi:DUF7210 family protein, partial [Escherichia coli]
MKLIALKPIYFGGTVVTEGLPLETLEQHGRELLKKGYAMLDGSENPAEQEQQQQHCRLHIIIKQNRIRIVSIA